MNFKLPEIDFDTLDFCLNDNVSNQGRSNTFEDQNKNFINAGYTEHNSCYLQTFNVGDDCINFGKSLFPRFSMSIIKQYPGQTIPSHLDTFFNFSRNNNVDASKCIRLCIFLEDWKTGHYFEIDQKPFLQWKRGDAIMIHNNEYHLSGNMGMVPKYTMQVTGVKNEFEGC